MKKQIGVCYACNEPVYDNEKYQKVGYEMKHTSKKCNDIMQHRMINDLPARHPDYKKPAPPVEVIKVEPVIVIPPLDTTCRFCKILLTKQEGQVYQCSKCQQTFTEAELRRGGSDEV